MPRRGAADSEQDAAFYDRFYRKTPGYKMPWESMPTAAIWREIAATIDANKLPVTELGCGTGQLASCLKERMPDLDYLGIDFSPVAIWIAEGLYPYIRFKLADFNQSGAFKRDGAVVLSDVLSRIENDRILLHRVPPGRLVVFTLPNFDDPGYLRYFDTAGDLTTWYESCFSSLDARFVATRDRLGFWLAIGRT